MKKKLMVLLFVFGIMAALPTVVFADDPPPPPPPPACYTPPTELVNSIIKVAEKDGRFTTFAAAARVAGLENLFGVQFGLTVFAPTNEAFAKLPAGELEALLANPGQLRQVLLYHSVQDPYNSPEAANLGVIRTGLGKNMDVRGGVINGSANIVVTDIMAENGIIHGINNILVPPVAEFTTRNLPPAPISAECACALAVQNAGIRADRNRQAAALALAEAKADFSLKFATLENIGSGSSFGLLADSGKSSVAFKLAPQSGSGSISLAH